MSLRAALLALTVFTAPAYAAEPAPVSALVKSVDIPYEQFTLPNGLRVIVHTDRKAPVVAMSIWYHIGSKNEPAGKTGFAHLFEHMMFYGSENAPGDYFKYLQDIGGTDLNGTTWYDRTNYFQTVPTGALDRALFLESDRMGHLLGGITQAKLDNQRGVVQNEKREGDNRPFGTVDYVLNDALFPAGHPYRHQTIGSMTDLNAASLDMVKAWFAANYGPNNAVLALAGDIDLATAKAQVTKWFGDFPRGQAVARPQVSIPTLAAPADRTIHDQVPYARVQRTWAVEGVNGRDTNALRAAAAILGGLASSRLDNALVKGAQVATAVSAGVEDHEDISFFTVSANVKAGQEPAAVAARLDALVAKFLKDGPTADEVQRAATKAVAGAIGGYESTGGFSGKAPTLATGLLYSGDPAQYKKDLADYAALTPARIAEASRKWLGRPAVRITVLPGPREDTPEMKAIRGDAVPAEGRGPALATGGGAYPPLAVPDRKEFPPVGTLGELQFPAIERTNLANGIPVYFARRADTPTVRVSVSFDAGTASDPKTALGTHAMTLAMLDEGTDTRNSIEMAEAEERLGATINTNATLDRSTIGLYAVKANLAPSIELLAETIRRPAFPATELERVRGQALAATAAALANPEDAARYLLGPIVYGKAHPYGVPGGGLGDPAAIKRVTADDLRAFHRAWFRPSKAAIFAVGDTSLAELKPLLEASFGNWPEDRMATPRKALDAPLAQAAGKIYLVDKPGAPQSYIRFAQVLPTTGKQDLLAFKSANSVLGSGFTNRLTNNLRETKGWSYGAYSGLSENEGPAALIGIAPVQTDRTGESLAELIRELRDFTTTRGVTTEELTRSVNGSVRELPGSFETSAAVLTAMQDIVRLGRPDDYYRNLPARYRALDAATLDASARRLIDPAKVAFIVVGDAKVVRPQLEKLGMPIETVTLPAVN